MGGDSACDKLSFLVTWDDPLSGLTRQFNLIFNPGDSTVEMSDNRSRKTFLKKTVTTEVKREDLYLGNTLLLLSRRLQVVDYGDEVTRSLCSQSLETTVVILPSEALNEAGRLLAEAQAAGFSLGRAKIISLNSMQVRNILGEEGEKAELLCSGPTLAMELVMEDAVSKFAQLASAKGASPVRSSASPEEARRESASLLPPTFTTRAPPISWQQEVASTCCLVKPHAMAWAGAIIEVLQEEGFSLLGMATYLLTFHQAEEFLEVYRGVVEEWGESVTHLSSGPCLALQLGGEGDLVERLRELCGPPDPAVAKLIRPKSLRARFGESTVKNGVHCTDLPEDALLEINYFFSVLQ